RAAVVQSLASSSSVIMGPEGMPGCARRYNRAPGFRRTMIHTLLVLAPLSLPAAAQKKEPAAPPAQPGTSKTFPDLGLTIRFPASFSELQEQRYSGTNQLRQRWNAKLGSVSLQIDLWAIPIDAKFDFQEPEDVMDMLLYNLRDAKGGDP